MRSGSTRMPTTATGAFKVGTHDDLVTALGLAAQDRQRSFSYARAPPQAVKRAEPRLGWSRGVARWC